MRGKFAFLYVDSLILQSVKLVMDIAVQNLVVFKPIFVAETKIGMGVLL